MPLRHTDKESAQERVEPHLNANPAPSFAHPNYEELYGKASFYGTADTPPRRPLSHFIRMLGVFAIGATVGLAAAWWMNKPGLNKPGSTSAVTAIERPGLSTGAPVQQSVQGNHAPAVKGISPGELPYDGAPPPRESREPAPETAFAKTEPNPTAPADKAPSPDSSAAAPEVHDAPVEIITPKSVAPATPATPAPKPKIQAKAVEKKSTRAAPRHRSTQTAVKDKEIERIKQQADEELKKKTEAGRSLDRRRAKSVQSASQSYRQRAASASSESKTSGVHAMFARCERVSNLFRREQCKWRLCGGNWGKNGCPSYSVQASSY